MGTGPFAVPMFRALVESPHELVAVVTRPDHAPPGRKPPANPMRQAATAAGIGILDPEKVNEPAAVTMLAALRPDLFVVCDYGQILSRDLLGVPPLGGGGGASCAITAGESRSADKRANDFSMNDPLNNRMSLMVSAS